MINKEENKKNKTPNDTANVGTMAHIVIKDKQTGKEIINQRG